MRYPLSNLKPSWKKSITFYRRIRFYVHFPIECRVTAGEDAFLSPTQGQETVFLAFHMYKGMDDGPYFKWVHNLMEKYGGRPHFGKMNNLTSEKLKILYPNVNRFMEIREQYDPNRSFYEWVYEQLFMCNICLKCYLIKKSKLTGLEFNLW